MNKSNSSEEKIPACAKCLECYDLDEHEPHSLNKCPHTICKKCIINIQKLDKINCPLCNSYFDHPFPNIAFIDILKPKFEKLKIIQENETLYQQLKSKLNEFFNSSKQEFKIQLELIRDQIKTEANSKINQIKINQEILCKNLSEINVNFMNSIYDDKAKFEKQLELEYSDNSNRSSINFKKHLKENLEKLEERKLNFKLNDVISFKSTANDSILDIGQLASTFLSNSNQHQSNWTIEKQNLKEKNIYEGDWKDGQRNGKGISLYSNGDKYEGDFKNNKRNGLGVYYFANGNTYEGDWKDDRRHGKGTSFYANGDEYKGCFKDDKKNGKDTYTFANGKKFDGNFKENITDGKGTIFYSNGNKYEGDFKDHKMNGKGTFYFVNGNRYEGDWKDDKRNGQGTLFYANGHKYQGEYKNELWNGKGTVFFPDGTFLKEDFKNGIAASSQANLNLNVKKRRI